MYYKLWILVLAYFFTTPASAQTDTGGQITIVENCNAHRGFEAFDFWLGDWTVTDRNSGQIVGTNKITKVEKGCAVEELWTSSSGSTGRSLNYYNPTTAKWRQIWVASGAYMIDISGQPDSDLPFGTSMDLKGHITNYRDSTKRAFRGRWTKQEVNLVRQFFEIYNPATMSWQTWFDGLYTRVEIRNDPPN